MSHVIESASSGRAKCRACGRNVAKGELRFGERTPNPYGEGEATYWFHLWCGAAKRPEPFLEALTEAAEIPDADDLRALAQRGVDHHRLVRFQAAQRAPSGRARCRHCREPIAKDTWRFVLDMWEDGRFGAMGFIHVACAPTYFGDTTDLADRIAHLSPELTADDLLDMLGHDPQAISNEPAPEP